LPQIARDIPLHIQLDNLSGLDLYYQILGWGRQGRLMAWYELPSPLTAHQSQTVPHTNPWPSGKIPGLSQWLVVASRSPLTALPAFLASLGPTPGQLIDIPQPLGLIRALLEDLQGLALPADGDSYYLALEDWVTLPLMYQLAS
jgi:hypothetical protein